MKSGWSVCIAAQTGSASALIRFGFGGVPLKYTVPRITEPATVPTADEMFERVVVEEILTGGGATGGTGSTTGGADSLWTVGESSNSREEAVPAIVPGVVSVFVVDRDTCFASRGSVIGSGGDWGWGRTWKNLVQIVNAKRVRITAQ